MSENQQLDISTLLSNVGIQLNPAEVKIYANVILQLRAATTSKQQ